jgi:RND family efflux transporter MFP subunit
MVKWSKNKPKAIPEAVPDKSTKEASLLLTDPVSNGSDAARRVMPLPPALLASLDGDEVTITRLTSVKADERPKGDRVELGGKPIYSFEFWHYHLLNVMFGFNGDSISGLTENISSTFGHDLAEEDVRALILQLNDLGLLNPTEARRHFLIKQILAENILSPDTATLATAREQQAAVEDSRKAERHPGLKLFRPKYSLRLLRPLSRLGIPLLIALVPMVVLALIFTVLKWDLIQADFLQKRGTRDTITLLLVGMFTVRLWATVVHAIAAQALTVTVEAVVLRMHFFIIPRFDLRLTDTAKLSRKQAIWLNAAPLFTKLFVASAALLIWNSSRHLGGEFPDYVLLIAALGLISFLISANPLAENEGYAILVQFLDEPQLRGKAMKALLNVGNPRFYQLANPQILLSYALLSIIYSLALVALFFLIFQARLVRDFGSYGYIIVGLIAVALVWSTISQLRTANEMYWQNYRFERWREQTLPAEKQKSIEKKNRFNMWRVTQLMLLTLIVFGLLQPYNYRPSGSVTLLPQSERELTTDIEGVVDAIYVQGGSYVTEGTLVAELQAEELIAQLRVSEAQLEEQKLAVDFAQTSCDRDMQLAESGTISDTVYERTLAVCAAETAELNTIVADIERQRGNIERTRFYMPLDGQIGTPDLINILGSFLREGESLATVRDTSSFRVQLQIREVDLSLVAIGAPIEVRMYTYPDRVFIGAIESIDPIVDETLDGTLIQLVASIENENQLLRPGMTGFAKTTGIELPVWRILTQSIYRFFTIDFWAWLP